MISFRERMRQWSLGVHRNYRAQRSEDWEKCKSSYQEGKQKMGICLDCHNRSLTCGHCMIGHTKKEMFQQTCSDYELAWSSRPIVKPAVQGLVGYIKRFVKKA